MKLRTGIAIFTVCLAPQLAPAVEPGTRVGTTESFLVDSARQMLQPAVAVSAVGDTAVVWREFPRDGDFSEAQAYLRFYGANGSPLGVPLELNQVQAGVLTSEVVVGIDDAGNATAVWLETVPTPDNSSRIRYARYSRSGARLGAVVSLDIGTELVGDPDIAVSGDGQALIVWSETIAGRIRAIRLDPGAAVAAEPFDVFSPDARETLVSLAAAMNRQGNGIVAWQTDGMVRARTVSASNSLGAIKRVDESAVPTTTSIDTAIDSTGQFTITWAGDPLNRVVRRRFDGSGNALEGEITIYAGQAGSPSIAVDEDGDTVIAWMQSNQPIIFAQYFKPDGQSSSSPIAVSDEDAGAFVAEEPEVAVDSDGDPVLVWQKIRLDAENGERVGILQRLAGIEDVDLQVSMSDNQAEAEAGTESSYVVTVRNAHPTTAGRGLGQAAGAVVDLALPADHVLSEITSTGWSCNASTCTSLEPLPAGSERSLIFKLTRPDEQCAEADAVVTITSYQADSIPANDTASDSTLVAKPGLIEFSPMTPPISESETAPMVAIVRTQGCLGGVSANLEVEGQTAEPGVDFVVGESVAFGSGEGIAMLPLSIIDDALEEEPETFAVTISSVSMGASIGYFNRITLQINDNDGGGGGGALSPTLLWLLVVTALATRRTAAGAWRPDPDIQS